MNLKHFLFEIECAEAVGEYKLADQLSNRLIKISSADPKSIIKEIKKTLSQNNDIKDIKFSKTLQKFVVSLDQSTSNSTKRKITSIAEPFKVSFKYSEKKPSFMDIFDEDPEEKAIRDILEGKEEPDEEDMILEKEVDPLSDDVLSLDDFLLEEARRHLVELGVLPKNRDY